MSDPLADLDLGYPFDTKMKNRIIQKYRGRGKRGISLWNKGAVVRKGRDTYMVRDRSKEYVVFEDTCTCSDYEQNEGLCAHIIAVELEKSGNPRFDHYDTEDEAMDAYYSETFGRG